MAGRQAARNARRGGEDRYRALFNALDNGFRIIEFSEDADGRLTDYLHVEANDGYERQTGIRGIVGMTVRNLAPDEADGWIELYGAVLRTGRPIRVEHYYFALAERSIEVPPSAGKPAPGLRPDGGRPTASPARH